MMARQTELVACACLGPQGGDKYCPCEMAQRGLEASNMWTFMKIEELECVLGQIFDKKDTDEQTR